MLVKVFGVKGEFQVFKNYVFIVFVLEKGNVEIVIGEGGYIYYDIVVQECKKGSIVGNKFVFKIEGGFIEVLNNEIFLLIQGVS